MWNLIQPILDEFDPPAHTGRKRIDQRAALDAVIYRLRTDCQWNQLPKEFPDDSSVHRTFHLRLVLACLNASGLLWLKPARN